MTKTKAAEPISHPRTAILTAEQVAAWLQVSVRFVDDAGLPRLNLPGRTARYSAGQILDYLEGRQAA